MLYSGIKEIRGKLNQLPYTSIPELTERYQQASNEVQVSRDTQIS
ncbi:hypothetical protein MNV_1360008 [Candidatus Methanoperedens nitroreducens]|uniref:Uncharacterized protein n=1 Tax=Candidatus Methanoperedens nitratireducens TaxID=1392998 RepID=A0A284VKI6_9EURY|nr:hypothetical protein MNV_1360008 [Candidatus Methanoperedens nitroreducens]